MEQLVNFSVLYEALYIFEDNKTNLECRQNVLQQYLNTYSNVK